MSDFIPNTFQTPNAIIDTLMFLLTDSEFRVLMYAVRHILGWTKKAPTRRACISLSTFEDGFSYDTPDGEISYPGCGLRVAPIRKALKSLQKYRILKAIGKPSQKGQKWELAFMTDDDVDIAGLKSRQKNQRDKNYKRTQKARDASPNNQEGVLSNSYTIGGTVQQSGGGTVQQSGGGTVQQSGGGTVQQSTTKDHSKDHSKDQRTLAVAPQTTGNTEVDTSGKKDKEPDKPDIKALADVIEIHLDMHNGRQWNIAHMLQGTAKKGEYAEYGKHFTDNPMSGDEFVKFMAYFNRECDGCSLAKAETIADWVGKFRANAQKQVDDFQRRLAHMPKPLNYDSLPKRDEARPA
jgi:hypothetical protein